MALDAEDLDHIREEEEHDLSKGAASPTPASAKNDGGDGATFLGNFMPPLPTQAPGGPSSSVASLDEGNASRTSPPTFADVDLGEDAHTRVHSSMLDILNRQIESDKL